MAMGKQPAACREQHNGLSVLLCRLIESAAEAVSFVSVQRKKRKSLFKKKDEGAEAQSRHAGGRSRDFSTTDRDRHGCHSGINIK